MKVVSLPVFLMPCFFACPFREVQTKNNLPQLGSRSLGSEADECADPEPLDRGLLQRSFKKPFKIQFGLTLPPEVKSRYKYACELTDRVVTQEYSARIPGRSTSSDCKQQAP